MSKIYETIIVGAGPAGLIAGKYLADSLILDKKREIGTPVQCGEGISEQALKFQGIKADPAWSSAKIYSHPQNIFEIWVAKIPNPDANKGKSGGYRLIYYIYIEEQKLFVDKIENRKNLDYKRAKGKNQKKWNKYLSTLKKELYRKKWK